ncbi:ABC transporter ATP-binding protein/permease [Flavobacteriaceae bacterium]|nr:ABC transporter ATP-binding protein/permease [Flavobacteriaceae bacterium]
MKSNIKKLIFLITKNQRKGLIVLTLLLFIGMFLEVFGLGILIPALSILLDPESLEKTPILVSFRNLFPNFSHESFLVIFLLAIVIIYLVKAIFLVFLTHKQNRFINKIMANISNNLFYGYMNQPYSFHLKRNASELLKNIQVEINYLLTFLHSLISICIEGGFVISIIAALIYIDPVGAISIGIFYGVLSIIFIQFTKRKLDQWGQIRIDLDAKVSKTALDGLASIKDLIILGKTSFFIDKFSTDNLSKARVNANQGTVSQIPRFYLELISIVGLVSFIMMKLFQGEDVLSLITVLGVFVAATFRMIPSINRIIAATQAIKFFSPSVEVIYNEIIQSNQNKIEVISNQNFNFQKNIEFRNINFSFSADNIILNDVSFNLVRGQTIGVIGESGSGKSTLVDLLIGLHKPDSGQILIDGISGFQINQSFRNKIGYVSQSINLIDESIKKNIAFGISDNKIDDIKIKDLLVQVQLEKFVNSLQNGVNTKVGDRGVQLSGGQRQRIGIARALYHNPDILILDEATSALDTETEKEVMKSIYNLKGQKTIIIVAHRLTTLELVDEMYEVKNNKLNKLK